MYRARSLTVVEMPFKILILDGISARLVADAITKVASGEIEEASIPT